MLTVPSFAFVPLAIPVIVSATIHSAVIIAGLYYYLKPGGSSTVKANGDVSRPSVSSWIDLSGPVAMVNTNDIDANISYAGLQDAVLKNDTTKAKYPNLASKLEKPLGDAPVDPQVASDLNGKKVFNYITGQWEIINNVAGYCGNYVWGPNCGPSTTTSTFPYQGAGIYDINASTWYVTGSASDGRYTVYSVTDTSPASPPVKVPVPGPVFASEMTNPLPSAYQDEIDKMLHDGDYVPTFSDSTTGLPFVAPTASHVASPQQVATYNANAQATESATAAASASSTAATNAGNAYTASGGNIATGQGGDQNLYQQYLNAMATAAQAQATADALTAQQTAQTTTDDENVDVPAVPGDNTYDSTITAPVKSNIVELLTSFVSGSPLVSMVQSFTVSTSNASGVVPIGMVYGQDLAFDFTRWESTLRACGGVLIIIMHGFSVFVVIRGW